MAASTRLAASLPGRALTAEEGKLESEISALTRTLAPHLLDEPGVGTLAAAQLFLSLSDPGCVRSDAAFAWLAVCAPTSASSAGAEHGQVGEAGGLRRALRSYGTTSSRFQMTRMNNRAGLHLNRDEHARWCHSPALSGKLRRTSLADRQPSAIRRRLAASTPTSTCAAAFTGRHRSHPLNYRVAHNRTPTEAPSSCEYA